MPAFTLKFNSETIVANSVAMAHKKIEYVFKAHPNERLVSIVCEVILVEEQLLEGFAENVVDG